jgi:hypothetical protein
MTATQSERVRVRKRVIAVEERYGDSDLAALWGCSARTVKRLREAGELGQAWLIAGRPVVGARGVQAYEESRRMTLDEPRVFCADEGQGDNDA